MLILSRFIDTSAAENCRLQRLFYAILLAASIRSKSKDRDAVQFKNSVFLFVSARLDASYGMEGSTIHLYGQEGRFIHTAEQKKVHVGQGIAGIYRFLFCQ